MFYIPDDTEIRCHCELVYYCLLYKIYKIAYLKKFTIKATSIAYSLQKIFSSKLFIISAT